MNKALRRFGPTCAVSLLVLGGLSPLPQAAEQQSGTKIPQAVFRAKSTQDYNQRLLQLRQLQGDGGKTSSNRDYRIGPEDLLEISVYGAPDLGRTVRVSEDGEVSLPLIGAVEAAGLTARELAAVVEELLRQNYMTNPQVNVFVRKVESHPISVFGAVEKPGVFQVRGAKTLIEVLSMAQGLADDAGGSVIVMRHSGRIFPAAADSPDPQSAAATDPPRESAKQGSFHEASNEVAAETGSVRVSLKELLGSRDARYDVMVYPGDVVDVPRAGVVYVVGEVKKPGGFLMRTNGNISVLQAVALAGGLTHTSAAKHARIIRIDEATGARREIAINLSRILEGKAADPRLRSRDIVFIPNSASKAALYQGAEAALSIAGGVIVYRR